MIQQNLPYFVCPMISWELLDRQQDVILVLLDLSAAFDTIDHDILLQRLHSRFGFSGSVLNWFRTYLHGRSQCVTIGACTSDSSALECGVPQGSVLGPLLFTLYIAPLEDLIRAHNLNPMFYADDTQVYIIMNPADVPASLSNLHKCLHDITTWNTTNMLMCNPGKLFISHPASWTTCPFSSSPSQCLYWIGWLGLRLGSCAWSWPWPTLATVAVQDTSKAANRKWITKQPIRSCKFNWKSLQPYKNFFFKFSHSRDKGCGVHACMQVCACMCG